MLSIDGEAEKPESLTNKVTHLQAKNRELEKLNEKLEQEKRKMREKNRLLQIRLLVLYSSGKQQRRKFLTN